MKNRSKICSLNEHQEINAISFCQKCNIYMCNKCQNFHSALFKNHYILNLDKDINDIFTGICEKENHQKELEFYCKTHNILCCVGCISKIKNQIYGQHTDCEILSIEEIKEEKKSKLQENINKLENISNYLDKSINDLKTIFEKINKNRENVKLKIQKIFTKIRNAINDREDELLLEVDNQLKNLFFDEDFVKKGEKLPNIINKSLEKGNKTNDNWNNDKLNILINNCINIENNINEINLINQNIGRYNDMKNVEVKFSPPNEYKLNSILEIIKNFGKIFNNNIKYSFLKIVNLINTTKKNVKLFIYNFKKNIRIK